MSQHWVRTVLSVHAWLNCLTLSFCRPALLQVAAAGYVGQVALAEPQRRLTDEEFIDYLEVSCWLGASFTCLPPRRAGTPPTRGEAQAALASGQASSFARRPLTACASELPLPACLC